MGLEIASRSKINLYLKVRNRRADGYHELETLFYPLDAPVDRITLDFADFPGIRVSCSLLGVPEDQENLAGRAALAYATAAGIEPVWTIHIEKSIPVAAGMGGGSSNAAAVLRMLNDHYKQLNEAALAALALPLGADVPFFLNPRPAVATGVGEICRYPDGISHAPPILIVNPQFPVSAKWAYENLDRSLIGEDDTGKLKRLIEALQKHDLKGIAENIHNDLAPALYQKFPLLSLLRDFMLEHGALKAEITGSGPSLFAICENVDTKSALQEALANTFEGVAIL